MLPCVVHAGLLLRLGAFVSLIGWLCAALSIAAAAPACAADSEPGQTHAEAPDGVYVSERMANVVIAGCVLREERFQGDWRFLRRADLAAVAPERLEYVRGEDGRYEYILHAKPGARPVRFLQERDGRVVSDHYSSTAVFVSRVTEAEAADALYDSLRRLLGHCAGAAGAAATASP